MSKNEKPLSSAGVEIDFLFETINRDGGFTFRIRLKKGRINIYPDDTYVEIKFGFVCAFFWNIHLIYEVFLQQALKV